jgi:hypothetical protein
MSIGSNGNLGGRVLRLERAGWPGHFTIAGLMAHARGTAPPPCQCPTCQARLAELAATAERWRDVDEEGR